MKRVGYVLLAALLVWEVVVPGSVYGQVSPSLTQGMSLPVSLVAPSGAVSAGENAAAMTDVDGWALTYAHQEGPDGSLDSALRDSVWAAFQAGEHAAFGTGFNVERPAALGVVDHGSLIFSGALEPNPALSFGATWRIRLPRGPAPAAHTADLNLLARPHAMVAFLLGGQNLAVGGANLSGTDLTRRALLGVNVRPTGDQRLNLELLGSMAEGGDFGFRGQAGVHVPYFGQLLVSGELQERGSETDWLLSAGARLVYGNAALGGAALSDGELDQLGWSVWTDLQKRPRPGLPERGYVAKIEVQGGPRGVPRTVRMLERALFDPAVRGVVLRPGDSDIGLAAAQEIRLAIIQLQKADKPVYCYIEAASGPEYYACARAERVALDPAGNIRLTGVATESFLLGDLLERIGLRADFIRIGRYKSGPELFENRRSSEPAREQRETLLDDAYLRLTEDLARDLELTPAQVKSRIDTGPFTAADALKAGLVDATLDRTDLERDARALFGDHLRVQPLGPTSRHAEWGPSPQIGVVVVDGPIVDGENTDVPFLDIHTSGGHTVSKVLDEMAKNPRIKAIVLRVDSPGGAAMASDQIWRAVRRAGKHKPVVASMGGVAASGGYYVASAADEIWAAPSSITGSIGIFFGKVDAAQLADKLDVGVEHDSRGAHAGAESLFRPFTPDERATLADKLRFWYRQFLERVAEGRSMEREEVDRLARGRVYSGDRAQAVGLVDGLGGFNSALARARELANLEPDASLVVRPERPSSLFEYLVGGGGPMESWHGSRETVSKLASPWAQGLWLMTQLTGDAPLALWEGPVELH